MENVKVSVIVPVYNSENYLAKCLDSLINQTLKDIEIICINDGSTDSSLDILKEYAKKDSRIVIIDKVNEGQGIARNIAIENTSGKYLGFVDSDDVICTEMFEKMFEQAEKLNSEIVICDILRNIVDTQESNILNLFSKATAPNKAISMTIPIGENIEKSLINQTLLISPCYSVHRIFKKSFICENNIKFSKNRCYEDCIFILKSHILAKNISYINTPYYIYNIHKNSTLRKSSALHLKFLETTNELIEYLKTSNLYKQFENNINYFTVMNSVWIYQKLTKKEQQEFLKLLKKQLSPKLYTITRYQINSEFYKKIFQITNKENYKLITILGLTYKYKHCKGVQKQEEIYLKKLTKNKDTYPKDSYLLFDCLNDATVESIDAYSLFKYMKSAGKKAYYVLLKESALYKKLQAENDLENIIVLEQSSRIAPDEFIKAIYEVLLRCKAVITSFGENTPAANKFFKENPQWEYIFIQHGPTYLKESVFDGYLYPEKFDKIMVSSAYENSLFIKYGWEEKQLIKAGMPRWDLLENNKKQEEKSILIMFTWRHLPSWEFGNSYYKKLILELLNNKELDNYLKGHNIKIYYALHHSILTNQGIDFKIENENISIVDTSEVSKYIKECSCLVTDFSSVAFDFMYQNKPILCYLMDRFDPNLSEIDKPDLKKFDYKQYVFPNIYFEQEDIINKIKLYVENDFNIEPEVQEKYNKFFYFKNNIREILTKEIDKITDK